MNEYVGGYYRYVEMPKPRLIAVRYRSRESLDQLPCTMYAPIVRVLAGDIGQAKRKIREMVKEPEVKDRTMAARYYAWIINTESNDRTVYGLGDSPAAAEADARAWADVNDDGTIDGAAEEITADQAADIIEGRVNA